MPRKSASKTTEFKKLQKKVNKISRGIETKHVDILLAAQEINFDSNETHALCLPVQGDAHNERIGDSIAPYRLNCKLTISNINTADDNTQFARVMIIQSKQRFTPNTVSTSGVTQLFSTANVDEVVVSNLVHDNRSHYVLLHDKTYTLSPAGNGAVVINISKKLSRKVEFEPGSTTTESGQIWICFVSNIAQAATGPIFTLASRILYTDA